jgi:hypothetical protein
MNQLRVFVFLLALAGYAPAQTPPSKPSVRLPVIVQPTPAPAPAGTPLPLKKGTVYMFDADIPVIVRSWSPGGGNLLKVTSETGPTKIKTWFADDPTNFQTRSFAGKYVYSVEPAGIGNATMMVIPTGLTDEKDIQSQSFAVDDGSKPVPPPAPPEPPAPADPLAASLQAAYTAETDQAKAVSAPRLAFLYQDIARTVVDDPKTVTVNDLIKAIIAQRKALIGDGLPMVRAAIDKEFQTKLGTATTPMDAAERSAAKAVLNNAATALGGVK